LSLSSPFFPLLLAVSFLWLREGKGRLGFGFALACELLVMLT
jgi:hypothetical protein